MLFCVCRHAHNFSHNWLINASKRHRPTLNDLVFVYDTRMGANDGVHGEDKVLTGFFRAPSPIMSVSSATPVTRLPLVARAAPCSRCSKFGAA